MSIETTQTRYTTTKPASDKILQAAIAIRAMVYYNNGTLQKNTTSIPNLYFIWVQNYIFTYNANTVPGICDAQISATQTLYIHI